MKREKKKTYTYATEPAIQAKAKKKAQKEGSSLSEKIDEFIRAYVAMNKKTTKHSSGAGLVIMPNGDAFPLF